MWRPEPEDELTELHAALADPWRLKVVTLLCERGELTHGQLMKHLGLTQPHTSQVLGYLRSRGLVYGDRRGRYVFYGLTYPVICSSLRALHREWLERRQRAAPDGQPASGQPANGQAASGQPVSGQPVSAAADEQRT